MSTRTIRHDSVRRALRLLIKKLAEERGQSLVETAIGATVLTVVLVGAVEMGRLAYAAIEVSSAARAGVAYGARNAAAAADTTGMQTAATSDGSDITRWKSVGLTATASESCTCSDGTSVTCANAAANCVSPGRIIDYVQVNTTATVDPLFHLLGLPTTYVLNGHAIMRVE